MALTSKRCWDICVAWRRALGKLWNVPYRTHNKILAILSNNLPLEMSLDKRFIKFSNNVLNHTQRRVQPDQCYFTVQIAGINFECSL